MQRWLKLKECGIETETVAYFLDPCLIGKRDLWQQFSSLKESCLIETLRHNKVVMNFQKKLELDPVLKDRIFRAFPRVKVFCDDISLKSERDQVAFREIKREFSENDIDFMLIKSDGYFPYESDNLDILIKPNMLGEVVKLLRRAGYSELPQVREQHKYLFRNARTPDVLPLHIHTRVEWEGTQFADSSYLWRRSNISDDYDGFSVPSSEDCILITCAHLFFENHEVKIADLLKITSKLRTSNINWDYMFDHASRLNWNNAFCLTILLVNLIYKELSGRNMLSQDRLIKIEETNYGCFKLFQRTLRPFSSGCTPLQIPYSLSVLFFIQRVLGESDLSLYRRFRHLDWVASNVLRERSIRSREPSFAQARDLGGIRQ
jgi:hypothetical protein